MEYDLQTSPLSSVMRGKLHTSSTLLHFRFFFKVSLKRSLGRPTRRDPFTSSEYSSCLAGLSSPMRQRWPNQLRRLLTNFISISSTFARLRTSSFLAKSSHFMLRMIRRWRCCKVRSSLTRCWYTVHVSLPYVRSGTKHWLYTATLVGTVRSWESKSRSKAHDTKYNKYISLFRERLSERKSARDNSER